jgi:transcriptional regulator with XRE-family HTH domain
MNPMIGKVLREIIKKEKLSYRRVALDLGIDPGNLYHSLMNGANPEWKTIEKLLDYLGYDFKLLKRKEVSRSKLSQKRERKRR